jgi:hypothetical protein
VLMGGGLHYRVPPGPVWPKAHGMNGPHQNPHGVQCMVVARRVRSVAWAEASGGWPIDGEVFTRHTHGLQGTD